MKHLRIVDFTIGLVFLALAGCATPSTNTAPPPPTIRIEPTVPGLLTAPAATVSKNPTAPSGSPTSGPYAPKIDPANFVTVIDNPFFPLKPGTTFVYYGKTEKGKEHNEVLVTSETKVIMEVTCVVVKDTVMVDGKLEEATIDWYTQDKSGNVWYFGEDAKDYDPSGKVISTAGSWVGGVNGAQPGIVMEASPVIGDPYRQEYLKGEAEDKAQVVSLSESATIKYGAFSNLVMTKEWSDLEPNVTENKYYAKGVGFILVTTPDGVEYLELTEIRMKVP
jgi:hypothetical protein